MRALVMGALGAAEFDKWLGVEFPSATGRKICLTKGAKAALLAGFKSGLVEENDVLADDVLLDEATMKEVADRWKAFYRDASAEEKTPVRETDQLSIVEWLKALYLDVATLEASKAPTNKPKPIPAAAKRDMDEQGATALWQLGWIELALALGRVPSEEECTGYSYKAPWKNMLGGKVAVKHSVASLDDLLEVASATGDISPIDRHFSTLTKALMEDKEDTFAMLTGGRVLSMYQEAKTMLKSDEMVIYYLLQYRSDKKSRGIPDIYDAKLGGSTTSAKIAGKMGSFAPRTLKDLRADVAASAGSSTVSGGSTVSSALGPSASAASESRLEAQLASVLTAVSKTASDVAGLSTSMGRIKASVDSMEGRMSTIETKGEGPKCGKCGSLGHFRRDCPQRSKAEREADAAKKAE